jgi:hypothetical protein
MHGRSKRSSKRAERRRIKRALAPVSIVLLAGMLGAQAAEFAFEPDIRASGEVNDNRRLTNGPHDTVIGSLLTLDALLAVRTERTSVEVTPMINAERYSDDAGLDLDNEDYILNMLIVHSASEISQLEIEVEMAEEALLRTEVTDTGILQAGATRRTQAVSPAWTWIVTEKDSLRIGFSSQQINNEGAGLVDYTFKSADTTWTHSFSERDQGSLTLFGSVFRIPDLQSKSRSAGFQVGYTRAFSETLTGTASIGMLYSDQEFIGLREIFPGIFILAAMQTENTGMLAAASVEKRWGERTVLSADFSNSVSPSSAGFLQTSRRLNANARHRFTERLTGTLGGTWLTNSSLGEETARQQDRDYYSVYTRLSYRLSEEWSVAGGYRYATQSYAGAMGSDPESNQLLITVAYNGHKRTYQN